MSLISRIPAAFLCFCSSCRSSDQRSYLSNTRSCFSWVELLMRRRFCCHHFLDLFLNLLSPSACGSTTTSQPRAPNYDPSPGRQNTRRGTESLSSSPESSPKSETWLQVLQSFFLTMLQLYVIMDHVFFLKSVYLKSWSNMCSWTQSIKTPLTVQLNSAAINIFYHFTEWTLTCRPWILWWTRFSLMMDSEGNSSLSSVQNLLSDPDPRSPSTADPELCERVWRPDSCSMTSVAYKWKLNGIIIVARRSLPSNYSQQPPSSLSHSKGKIPPTSLWNFSWDRLLTGFTCCTLFIVG